MSSSSAAFSMNHLSSPPPPDQLCYVHCNFCETVLAVSVPYSSLFKTVAVRCGHCTNLLSVNMKGLLVPAAPDQLHLNHTFSPSYNHNILDELPYPPPSLLMDHALLNSSFHHYHNRDYINSNMAVAPLKGIQEELPRNPIVSKPPEKRQRVPSAYNRFIKDEIQRLKAENPDITHREAFSAAAKNWAHFPHIHFGLMPDHALKKTSMHQQEGGEDVLLKNGFYAAAAAATNMGIVTPF